MSKGKSGQEIGSFAVLRQLLFRHARVYGAMDTIDLLLLALPADERQAILEVAQDELSEYITSGLAIDAHRAIIGKQADERATKRNGTHAAAAPARIEA